MALYWLGGYQWLQAGHYNQSLSRSVFPLLSASLPPFKSHLSFCLFSYHVISVPCDVRASPHESLSREFFPTVFCRDFLPDCGHTEDCFVLGYISWKAAQQTMDRNRAVVALWWLLRKEKEMKRKCLWSCEWLATRQRESVCFRLSRELNIEDPDTMRQWLCLDKI